MSALISGALVGKDEATESIETNAGLEGFEDDGANEEVWGSTSAGACLGYLV